MNFADHCTDIEHYKCDCGYQGHSYMFVTINGIQQCVRCAGSKQEEKKKPKMGQGKRLISWE